MLIFGLLIVVSTIYCFLNAYDEDATITKIFGVIFVILLCIGLYSCTNSCSYESSSNSDSYSTPTCQFSGCHRPAVGPTYEFCEQHKKALNDYWDAGGK